VMGVFHRDLVGKLAQVLKELGSRHVLVVHAADGLDEISLAGDTFVAELKDGAIREYVLNPAQFGLQPTSSEKLGVHNIDEAKAMFAAALGQPGPARDIVALNAGAAIYVGGLVQTLEDGVEKAMHVIASGEARAKLEQLMDFSRRFGS
jgi:anthranilate phosphoribosyltransferase